MRILFAFFIGIFIASEAIASDPPSFLAYKQKILTILAGEYSILDSQYNARFVTEGDGITATTTINKSAVYYDSTKALRWLQEMTYDRTGLTAGEIALIDQIPDYLEKSNHILAQFYIQGTEGGGGYMAFPHGLMMLCQSGADEACSGLENLRNKGNWMKVGGATREDQIYSRECAYALQIGINAYRMGTPYTTALSHTDLMDYYLPLVLSHVNQWATGSFYGTSQYMSAFMVGLSTNALIEYYERISPDPRIPPAVKAALDRLWTTSWHPDVTNPTPTSLGDTQTYTGMGPYGAFWTWADWVTDEYVIDRDHNPSSIDVGAIHNMIIGPAYAWYAVYANDESYMNKAVDTFNGTAYNASVAYGDGQFSETVRYTERFLKYYKKFYSTPCSDVDVDQCETQSACSAVGGNWTGEWCQHAEVVTQSAHIAPRRLFCNIRVGEVEP